MKSALDEAEEAVKRGNIAALPCVLQRVRGQLAAIVPYLETALAQVVSGAIAALDQWLQEHFEAPPVVVHDSQEGTGQAMAAATGEETLEVTGAAWRPGKPPDSISDIWRRGKPRIARGSRATRRTVPMRGNVGEDRNSTGCADRSNT